MEYKPGPSPGFSSRGGHIFKIQYWMYVANGGPNVKWGGTDFKWGAEHHWPPTGDGPGINTGKIESRPGDFPGFTRQQAPMAQRGQRYCFPLVFRPSIGQTAPCWWTWCTRGSQSCVVFPIRVKILKPGFRVAEKKNGTTRAFSGFEIMRFWPIITQCQCETTTVGHCATY